MEKTNMISWYLFYLYSVAPRGKRGWKTFYAVLKGMILYLQKVCLFALSFSPSHCWLIKFPSFPTNINNTSISPPGDSDVRGNHIHTFISGLTNLFRAHQRQKRSSSFSITIVYLCASFELALVAYLCSHVKVTGVKYWCESRPYLCVYFCAGDWLYPQPQVSMALDLMMCHLCSNHTNDSHQRNGKCAGWLSVSHFKQTFYLGGKEYTQMQTQCNVFWLLNAC